MGNWGEREQAPTLLMSIVFVKFKFNICGTHIHSPCAKLHHFSDKFAVHLTTSLGSISFMPFLRCLYCTVVQSLSLLRCCRCLFYPAVCSG